MNFLFLKIYMTFLDLAYPSQKKATATVFHLNCLINTPSSIILNALGIFLYLATNLLDCQQIKYSHWATALSI